MRKIEINEEMKSVLIEKLRDLRSFRKGELYDIEEAGGEENQDIREYLESEISELKSHIEFLQSK